MLMFAPKILAHARRVTPRSSPLRSSMWRASSLAHVPSPEAQSCECRHMTGELCNL
jgi:hypothetical protein